ncbi:MAG: hypothetical protein O7G30_05010 [Proteobacteria bacterium]|nr:hypothetical protein [Pseudomonadota bacterium]
MTEERTQTTPLDPRRRLWWFAALALAIGVLIAHASRYLDYTVDDAFISFRYGQHWADGHGLVFNPGDRVEGYSNLAWTVLFGAIASVASDPVWWMKGIALTLGAGALVLVAALALQTTGSVVAAAVAALLVAQSPFFAVWTVAGLETPLFAVELLAMVFFAARRQAIPYGVAAALCCLTRPEGVAMVLGVAAERTLRRRRLEPWLVWPLLAAAGQLAFRLVYYGDWVPNTAHVKLGGGLPQYLQGLAWIWRMLGDWSLWLALPGLATAPFLLSREPAIRISLALIAGYLAFLVYSGGDFFALFRLGVPIMPLMIVVIVATAAALGRRLPASGPWRAAGWGAIGVALVGCLVVAPLYRTEPARGRVARETRMLHHFSIPAAKWLREHSPPGSTVALTVAGAIPYYSGLRTIDRFGLSDAEIARADLPWLGLRSGISKFDPDSVLRRKPDWILLDINDQKLRQGDLDTLHAADRALLGRAAFRESYRLVDDWLRDSRRRLALYVRRGSSAEAGID